MTQISLLIITYNRSDVLAEAVDSMRRLVQAVPSICEIVVADDCSSPEHAAAIDAIPDVRVARTSKNSGLGANCNNGLAGCVGDLILQVQDDWIFDGDPASIIAAEKFIEENADIGIVQLSPIVIDLPVDVRSHGDYQYHVFKNDHVPWRRRCGVRPYSDNPHLKRREFCSSVGPYLEDVPMTICEAEYQKRVANQDRWRVAMLDARLFGHVGEEISLNPGGQRHWLVNALSWIPLGTSHFEPWIRGLVNWADHRIATFLAR